MRSWVSEYVGKPWAPGADGPESFYCWGLVRHVFRTREGIELPLVAVGEGEVDPSNVIAIKRAARLAGMRKLPAGERPKPMDIALLTGPGTLHIGVVVMANGRLSLLHASHAAGVTCDRFDEATASYQVELWRKQS